MKHFKMSKLPTSDSDREKAEILKKAKNKIIRSLNDQSA